MSLLGGSIGGLILIENSDRATYVPGYDGIGNITMLVNTQTSERTAEYIYSPYGKLVVHSDLGNISPFRYQTKWHLNYFLEENLFEHNLYDFSQRLYHVEQGRFINKDPIAEEGGNNLYAYVGNDPINQWDYLGHAILCENEGVLVGEITGPDEETLGDDTSETEKRSTGNRVTETKTTGNGQDQKGDVGEEDTNTTPDTDVVNPDDVHMVEPVEINTRLPIELRGLSIRVTIDFDHFRDEKDSRQTGTSDEARARSQNEEIAGAKYGDYIEEQTFRSPNGNYGKVQYGKGNLFIKGNESFRLRVFHMLNNHLWRNSDGVINNSYVELIETLMLSEEPFYIKENLKGSVYEFDTNTVWLQMRSVDFDDGLGLMPSYVNLAHELGHAYADAIGRHAPVDPNYKPVSGDTPIWEGQAINAENDVRIHNGLTPRASYIP